MVMNGFDTNFDRANEVYAVNSIGFAYLERPIEVARDELVRIYLVNALEYDLLNSFHVHGHFFHYFPTGTSREPAEYTDTVMQCQGQRGIAELCFPRTGRVHVPRPPVRVRRARLAGPVRGEGWTRRRRGPLSPLSRAAAPAWLLGLLPLVLLTRRDRRRSSCSARPASASGADRRRRRSPSSARALEPGVIELTVRNDGPDAVRIAQVVVNDAFAAFSGGRRRDRAARVGDPAHQPPLGRGRGVRGRSS